MIGELFGGKCYGECHTSESSVIEILEVRGWKIYDFGSSLLNMVQCVLAGDIQYGAATGSGRAAWI